MGIRDYLEAVLAEKLPINQDILPNLSKAQLIKAFQTKKNDLMLNIYIAALLRSILALDGLLQNRIENKMREDKKEALDRKKATGTEDDEKSKDKEEKKEEKEKKGSNKK